MFSLDLYFSPNFAERMNKIYLDYQNQTDTENAFKTI